jgi:hypothetical protein
VKLPSLCFYTGVYVSSPDEGLLQRVKVAPFFNCHQFKKTSFMNSLNIPVTGNPKQQRRQLQEIKDAMTKAMITHPGMLELIAEDPSLAQIQLIYLEAQDRLSSMEVMDAMQS